MSRGTGVEPRERARRLTARLLLVVATFVSVMGFNFTGNLAFVPLPFIAGIALIVLIRKAPKAVTTEEMSERVRGRRQGVVQLIVCCLMVTGFLVNSAVSNNWRDATGFAIILGTLALLALLGYLAYKRASRGRGAVQTESVQTMDAFK